MSPISSRNRIGNILAYYASLSPDFGRIKMVKALCFTDLVSYNLFNRMVTGDRYYALPKGPMGTCAGDLTISGNEFLKVTRLHNRDHDTYKYEPYIPASLEGYTLREQMLIEANRRWVQLYSADAVSNITHRLSLWKGKPQSAPIPREDFALTGDDERYLKNRGILITEFGKNFCSVADSLPTLLPSLDYADIDEVLSALTKTFPTDLWDEYDDCFLAYIDSVLETSQTKGAARAIKPLCERGAAMAAALAYTPNLSEWVQETLKSYADIFDKAATDALGTAEDMQTDTDNDISLLMTKLRKNAADAVIRTE